MLFSFRSLDAKKFIHTSMDFHMIRERSSLSKTFIAICTSIGLFTWNEDYFCNKIINAWKYVKIYLCEFSGGLTES